jgi:fructose-bisphosphate aldolase, class I
MQEAQTARIRNGKGFVAALDQSGGSTPAALARYGLGEDSWSSQKSMFELMHSFRTRIITSPSFSGAHILGAILFERTLERDLDGLGIPDYLWQRKQVVPFLKVDRGLAEEADKAQLMKPLPDLILAAGLVPIIEPEVDIHAPDKPVAEAMVTAGILERLAHLPQSQQVMLKLTLPTEPNLYLQLISHPRVLRVLALSGGYSRDEANRLLAANNGLIASFSRALTEGLQVSMTDEEFDAALGASIAAINAASLT